MKLKFRSKFNHGFTNHGYLHSTVWKANYSFKMFKIMRSLRSSKCLKTTVDLTFTTQKANACSPWTACFVFKWKYFFSVNLVQKHKIIILSWNFITRLIQICRIPWWCSLFLLSTRNTFLGKIVCPKWNLIQRLIRIWKIHWWCLFYVLDWK